MEHNEKLTWNFPILFLFLNLPLATGKKKALRNVSCGSLRRWLAKMGIDGSVEVGISVNQRRWSMGFPWVFLPFCLPSTMRYLMDFHTCVSIICDQSPGRYAEGRMNHWDVTLKNKEFSSLVHLFSVDTKIMLQEGSPFMASGFFQVG